MIGIVLLFLVTLIIPHHEGANDGGYVPPMLTHEQYPGTIVSTHVPAKIGGGDLTPRLVIVVSSWQAAGSTR